ncbi:FHA domain-containing protein [Tabrizicola sp.]|uniref:FHA domain-containing protein n=1 Tax=Tabrizicola sp. TaxID=2005166 RepID=UPI00286BB48F|nr:FHA domain-containing protein [Tabrizicola sp.]
MKLMDRLLRRRTKSRPLSPQVFAGNEAEQAEAARVALDALRGGTAGVANSHGFPKLSDAPGAREEILAKASPSRNASAAAPSGTTGARAPAVNIWDIEDDAPEARPAASTRPTPSQRAEAASAEAAPKRRQNRTKTRMLGFEPQESSIVSLFDESEKSDDAIETTPNPKVVMFPAGWLVVKQGAGRGATFPLIQGVSVIGRGADQSVSLDYGDMSISRSNHAAIAYDATSHQFHVGHGGKSNLVRLNGRPLLSTEVVRDGDEIQVGETVLMLKVLCTLEFNWSQAQAGGEENDMAIA